MVALALASAAAVGALRLLQRDPVQDLSLEPRPDVTAPSVTPAVSPAASSRPSPTRAALTWTPARLEEDWPAPVRAESEGVATVVPILLPTDIATGGRYVDLSGDTGSVVLPGADIREVTFCGRACLSINLGSYPPPAVGPTEPWIGYGIVADTDRDGVPDWRYGTDYIPVDPTGVDRRPQRWWRTDLHTGRTESVVGEHVVLPSGTTFYGGPGRLTFGSDVTGGHTVRGALPERFYVWASVIQDGQVLATDYAPDVGWLHPSPDAKP